jgi:uncharacterized paraquat-inducible protein A
MVARLASCIECSKCKNVIMLNEYQRYGGYCKRCAEKLGIKPKYAFIK